MADLGKFIFLNFFVQHKQCDQVIRIPNLNLKTKKCCLGSLYTNLYVNTKGFTLVLSFLSYLFVSLYHLQFLILVSKYIYTWQKPQGWWSVVWDGKKLGFLQMLICSFGHFYFYVNIYSLFSFVIDA